MKKDILKKHAVRLFKELRKVYKRPLKGKLYMAEGNILMLLVQDATNGSDVYFAPLPITVGAIRKEVNRIRSL